MALIHGDAEAELHVTGLPSRIAASLAAASRGVSSRVARQGLCGADRPHSVRQRSGRTSKDRVRSNSCAEPIDAARNVSIREHSLTDAHIPGT